VTLGLEKLAWTTIQVCGGQGTELQLRRRRQHRRLAKLAEEDYTDFDTKVEGAGITGVATSTPEDDSRHKELFSHLC